MAQLHRRFMNEEVRVLFRGYCQGSLTRSAVQRTLGIGKTRFFALLKEYRRDSEAFSVFYERATPSRLTPSVEQEIASELPREKRTVEDRRLPISGYNYSALRDRLAKRGIKVSVTTIIDRAKRLASTNTVARLSSETSRPGVATDAGKEGALSLTRPLSAAVAPTRRALSTWPTPS